MTMRSIPPASSSLALMPVPAPPPTIGTPRSTCWRSRSRTWSRVNAIECLFCHGWGTDLHRRRSLFSIRVHLCSSVAKGLLLFDQPEHHVRGSGRERRIIDVRVELDVGDAGAKAVAERVEHRGVGLPVAE